MDQPGGTRPLVQGVVTDPEDRLPCAEQVRSDPPHHDEPYAVRTESRSS